MVRIMSPNQEDEMHNDFFFFFFSSSSQGCNDSLHQKNVVSSLLVVPL